MISAQRLKLLLILATMPDEAFGWLVLNIAKVQGRPNVWPDGLGGFKPDSRAAIAAAREAATAILEAPPAQG